MVLVCKGAEAEEAGSLMKVEQIMPVAVEEVVVVVVGCVHSPVVVTHTQAKHTQELSVVVSVSTERTLALPPLLTLTRA